MRAAQSVYCSVRNDIQDLGDEQLNKLRMLFLFMSALERIQNDE